MNFLKVGQPHMDSAKYISVRNSFLKNTVRRVDHQQDWILLSLRRKMRPFVGGKTLQHS